MDVRRLFQRTLMSLIEKGLKMHVTIELSLSFWDKVGAKASYLVDVCPFTGINFQTLMVVWSRKIVTYPIFYGHQSFSYCTNKAN